MAEERNIQPTNQNQEQVPKWLKEFRSKVALFDVAYKAFDPSISDAEIRRMLKEAAKEMDEIQIPGQSTTY